MFNFLQLVKTVPHLNNGIQVMFLDKVGNPGVTRFGGISVVD